jgi:xanthine dehydrogenase accessory factor
VDRRLTREALRLMESHQPFVRATVVKTVGSVPGKLGAAMLIRADGSFLGTIGGAALEERVKELARLAFDLRAGDLHHFDLQSWKEGGLPSLCGGAVEIALEYVAARPNLLLWGGGHVAQALAAILPTLEYDYTVADDRPEWIEESRFPEATRRVVVSAESLLESVEPSSFTHLYVLGYDARKDLEVLAQALDRFPNFIGLIASTTKREHLFASLRQRGVSEDLLRRIHTPVGVPLGAETPPEIAVSIVGEIVQAMHPTRSDSRTRDTALSPEGRNVVLRSP